MSDFPSPSDLVSLKQAAHLLGTTSKSLYAAISTGNVKVRRRTEDRRKRVVVWEELLKGIGIDINDPDSISQQADKIFSQIDQTKVMADPRISKGLLSEWADLHGYLPHFLITRLCANGLKPKDVLQMNKHQLMQYSNFGPIVATQVLDAVKQWNDTKM